MAGALTLRDAAGGRLNLSPADFLASGGQADVYRRGDEVFKLYYDPAATPPLAKLNELARLDARRVAVPTAQVYDGSGRRPVGIRMPWVADALTLAEVAVPAFQRDHGIDRAAVLRLVARLAVALVDIHAAGMAVADLSDLNVLVDRGFTGVRFIDADSWRTPGFPADAENPAFRDPRAAPGQHDAGTDWFAFAVLAFMLFIGAHPFRGRHRRHTTLDERMAHGVSALDSSVTLPPVCFSRSRIPSGWQSWLRGTLERGDRDPPPSALLGSVTVRSPSTLQGVSTAGAPVSRRLRQVEVERFPAAVVDFTQRAGVRAGRTAERCFVDGVPGVETGSGEHVLFWSEPSGWPLLASLRDGVLTIVNALTGAPVPHRLEAHAIGRFDGRLVLVGDSATFTVVARNAGNAVVVAIGTVLRRAPAHAIRLGEDAVTITLRERIEVLVATDAGPATIRLPSPAAPGSAVPGRALPRAQRIMALRARGAWLSVLSANEHGAVRRTACFEGGVTGQWCGPAVCAVAPLEFARTASGHVLTLDDEGNLATLSRTGGIEPLAEARVAPGVRLRDADGCVLALAEDRVVELHYA